MTEQEKFYKSINEFILGATIGIVTGFVIFIVVVIGVVVRYYIM